MNVRLLSVADVKNAVCTLGMVAFSEYVGSVCIIRRNAQAKSDV